MFEDVPLDFDDSCRNTCGVFKHKWSQTYFN